jgi:hypothetical protein
MMGSAGGPGGSRGEPASDVRESLTPARVLVRGAFSTEAGSRRGDSILAVAAS